MSDQYDAAPFSHRAYAVDDAGREVPIEARAIVVRLASGESVEIPLDGYDAGDLLIYGGRMPEEDGDQAVAAARRLLVAPGATNLIAVSVVPQD